MTTIKQVAQEAGVSVGTVSNVLNNIATVNPENKQRVLEAIKKLNYRPNNAARILKTRRSQSISLILPDILNPFYPLLAKGAQNCAAEYGYTVIISNNDRSAHKERMHIDLMLHRGVDGIILVKPYLPVEELLTLSQKIPLALVDMREDGRLTACDIVNVDDYGGAQSAMRMIFDQGHTRIGFLRGSMDGRSDQERYRAYLDMLGAAGLSFDESLVGSGEYSWDSGFNQTLSMLSQPDAPTALFASNDILAIGSLRAAFNLGLSVPADLSIIGYDDIDAAAMFVPALTTIHRPKYEMGVSAVNALLKRIQSKNHITLPGQTVTLYTAPSPRQTLGPPRDKT